MLRKLRKRIKGQATAEYAVLMALVIGAIIAMQTYAKRALQARIKDATDYMVEQTQSVDNETFFNGSQQYEPYYLQSNFTVNRQSNETVYQGTDAVNGVGMNSSLNVSRTGSQNLTYNGDTTGY